MDGSFRPAGLCRNARTPPVRGPLVHLPLLRSTPPNHYLRKVPDYTRVPAPISTLRLTFQDGEELDIPSDIELAGLSKEDFRIAYAAFTKLKPISAASRTPSAQ